MNAHPTNPVDPMADLPAEAVDVTGWDVPPRETRVAKSFGPMRAMMAGVLVPESIVLGLSSAVLMANGDVPKPIALSVGLGLMVLCLVAGAGLRKGEWAITLGHTIQVIAVLLGFVVPMMFFVGGLFALLWGMAFTLGKKISAEKLAVWNQWERDQAAGA